jgi:hypothetical protein
VLDLEGVEAGHGGSERNKFLREGECNIVLDSFFVALLEGDSSHLADPTRFCGVRKIFDIMSLLGAVI